MRRTVTIAFAVAFAAIALARPAAGQERLADARVEGDYQVTETVTDVFLGGGGNQVGDVERYTATFVPACDAGPCDIRWDGRQTVLGRDAATYRGTGPALEIPGCPPVEAGATTYEFEVVDAQRGVATELRGTAQYPAVGQTGRECEFNIEPSRAAALVLVLAQPASPSPPVTSPTAEETEPAPSPTATPTEPAATPPDVDERVPGRSALALGVQTTQTVSDDLADIATNLAIAALLALLIVFPSELFNRTLETHYDEIRGWFPSRRQPIGASPPLPGGEAADTPATRRGWAGFAVVTLVSALLYGLLDPSFGPNLNTAMSLAGVTAALVVLTLAGGIASGIYLRRRFGDAKYRIRTFPGALLVAAACVAISRLAGFTPGYLYGLIAGFAFRRQLDDADEGRQTLVTSVALLGLSLVAWIAWVPIAARVTTGDPSVWLLVADAVLVSIFAAGIQGLIFGLVPLKFMSGSKLLGWSRAAWASVYVLALFSFLHLVVRPGSAAEDASSTVTLVSLFLAFGAISTSFWGYFRFRPRPA